MLNHARHINHYIHAAGSSLAGVRNRMAEAIIGQTVSLWVAPEQIVEGVVTNVRTESDAPTIVVHGMEYQFSQILTTTPASFCC